MGTCTGAECLCPACVSLVWVGLHLIREGGPGGAAPVTLQDWKASPMWKPIRALTPMEMLPG